MKIDEFVDRLELVEARPSGLIARCPAHEDREPSMTIAEGEDGRILLSCKAGCTALSIVTAMGLTLADLFATTTRNFGEPEATYDYVDAQGNLIFQVVRFPGKKFKQRHMVDGEWVWNMEGIQRTIYRLPTVLLQARAGGIVYVVEGEEDVHAIERAGGVATCNPGGAGKWKEEYSILLAGANLVIVQDRDEPGRNHAQRVKDLSVSKAVSVYLVQAAKGKDARDHLEVHGLPLDGFVPVREKLRKGVVSSQEMFEAAMEYLELGEGDLPSYDPLPWLAGRTTPSPRFRNGRLYPLGGYTGDGKTAFALQVTRELCTVDTSVGYFSLEMTEEDLRNRLAVHKGLPLEVIEHPWLMSPEQKAVYTAAMEEIRAWNLDVIFDQQIDAEKIAQLTEDGEYDFIIVDHVHRFGWGHERRTFEAQIARLTNLALEFNIPVMVLAQLRRFTRGQGMESYPRPTLQDFRESEMLAAEASMAMAIWRVRTNGVTYDPTGTSELIILKNRHGMTGEHFIRFDGKRQLFGPISGAVTPPATMEDDDGEQELRDLWG